MKKLVIMLVALTLILSVTACSDSPSGGSGELADSLEKILEKIYENGELSEDFKLYMLPGLYTTVITGDNMEYYLGKGGLDIKEAIASEHEMDTAAYSLCLIRVDKDADAEKIKKSIKDNVDPMKWVCVGVDEENVLVDSIGDVIILVMSNGDAQALVDAFRSLK